MNTQLPIHSLQSKDSFLETKKNQLLAAIYENNFLTLKEIYKAIFTYASELNFLDENTQKLLNQIQLIYKKFKSQFPQPIVTQLAPYNTSLSHLISAAVKKDIHQVRCIDLTDWENRMQLNEPQKNLICKTTMTFQLTSGCSNFCRRCNEWALPGVRAHFSYTAICTLIDHMAQQKNKEIALYGASDPLDWEQDGKTLSDILVHIEKTPLQYSILTKVPKGRQSLLKQLIQQHANLSVSVTARNKPRIEKIQAEIPTPLSRQHDTDDLLIPAGLDEDFSSVKPSITDGYGTEITPDGAFIIIPAFTSALHPFGHKKIPVTARTEFFPEKKTGRAALLVDYFKPLKGYNLNQEACCLDYLLEVQIESILLDTGEYELTPPGMRSVKEYLSIFEEDARIQRKKMTLSVIRHLKKEFLTDSTFNDLPDPVREIYHGKIHQHLDLCKKENCLDAKIHTLSFFLEAIYKYVKTNTTRTKIIKFLLTKESVKNLSEFTLENFEDIYQIISDSRINNFDFFRYMITVLLDKTEHSAIEQFIKTYPATYDPEKDIFVRTNQAQSSASIN
ncbi:MAG: hypothetical protein KKE62_14605 [Proteobacteria bacterium]|nr:hypothetical protein [Pseudomonadota bacterium]MBU1389242.1 hypothetical protein [Pseudomonadota bacterium]MBU1544062.1 hypothetical protein [Pseudomonadota bacterium]MBU2480253.1 hypothetical protein [Pseudomonadota bacterium]